MLLPRRHFPPNFYYNQEDYLAKRVREGASWTWNALRPGPICGYSHGSAMNVVVSTALYATLCKELDLGVLRCELLRCLCKAQYAHGCGCACLVCSSGCPRMSVRITHLSALRCARPYTPDAAFAVHTVGYGVRWPAVFNHPRCTSKPPVGTLCIPRFIGSHSAGSPRARAGRADSGVYGMLSY